MTRTMIPNRNPRSAIRDLPRPRNRGSVLILVVTILALMLLIGMAYVQTARNDRVSTAGVTSNINQVINAEIARISQTLKDDLVDSAGNFLDDQVSREPYDHAWTSTATGTDFDLRSDAWLASIGLGDGGGTKWPHITNISGQYVKGSGTATPGTASGGSNIDTDILPGTYSSSTDWTVVSANSCNADADDDGITDSKYTDSAIVWINGVRYVTAMRIIDLSGLLNVNTALALTNGSGTYDAQTHAPRWLYPSELDFNGFVGGSYSSEVQAMLQYRMGLTTTPVLPTPWANAQESRYNFWHDGVRYGFKNPTSPYSKYVSLGLAEELQLRYRNGLNDPTAVKTAFNSYMPTFIRQSNTEADYTSSGVPGGGTIANYLSTEPRHQMTVSSNATIITAKTANSPARTTQVDLNTGSNQAIMQAVYEIYSQNTPASPVPAGAAGYSNSIDLFAAQFAAAAKDYRDSDNTVTAIATDRQGNAISPDRLGFEKLPFIAEVYAQRKYTVSSSQTINNSPNPDTYNINWQAKGDAGYAIEIRNPFNEELKGLANIELYVKGTSWGTLATLTGRTGAGADVMTPYEVIVLYRDSDSGADANDDVGTLVTGGSASAITKVWPNSSGTLNVELRASVSDGNKWAYVKFASIGFPESYAQNGAAANPDPALKYYMQDDSQGNGNKLNVMFALPADAASGSHKIKEVTQSQPGSWSNPIAGQQIKLGDSSKVVGDVLDATSQQTLWRDDLADVFWQSGEVAQMVIVPCVAAKTFAEAWSEHPKVTDWMLDFDSTSMVSTSNNLMLPHAVVLLDRLTTLSPLTDGINNDNTGGTDDIAEQVIPGRINLNTTTEKMLMRTLPIPDVTARQKSVDAIINYRDKPSVRPNITRYDSTDKDLKGISSLSELMLAVTTGTAPRDVLGKDNADNFQMNGTTIDFIPETPAADNVIDDREEQALVMRWLGQVCTTRSDTFAAYIYIRGYDSGVFDADHLTEVARVLVIFDRSGITDKDGSPKIIGYVRYK